MPILRLEVTDDNFNDVLTMSIGLSNWIEENNIDCKIESVPYKPLMFIYFYGENGEHDLLAFRLKYKL
jgi:hypothetical protein